MRIAVLGKGNVGRTIGSQWARAGHAVVYGVRSPERGAPDQAPMTEAIGAAEVVLFAVPGTSVDELLEAHALALASKILIDATNDFSGPSISHAQRMQERIPSSKVYRALNTLGWENFAQPEFGSERADLFYCGPDDEPSIDAVERLITEVGLRPILVGDLSKSDVVDGVLKLWFTLAAERGMGRHLAFKLLQDPSP